MYSICVSSKGSIKKTSSKPWKMRFENCKINTQNWKPCTLDLSPCGKRNAENIEVWPSHQIYKSYPPLFTFSLSGGPWALKMESETECTMCAISKMSSDNSSFETGVGILWLMCTWAFQVLYSRAWQTSVATWDGARDICISIGLCSSETCLPLLAWWWDWWWWW